MKDVVIIGGGIAGLISGTLLARQNKHVVIIEKKKYPFHRVCGEYISNEAKPFLKKLNCFPSHLAPPHITRFLLSDMMGNKTCLPMEMGGFGVSRYRFDMFLNKRAREAGATVMEETIVNSVQFQENDDAFKVFLEGGEEIMAKAVIGAQGKRSRIDRQLNRSFMKIKSPFLGVKYHLKIDFPEDLIALHNFQNGYCGISRIENGQSNLCYLSDRINLKNAGSIEAMEEEILCKNPRLKEVFKNGDFLFEKPEVINEISFANKKPVEQRILMIGDAAGMITPLCGNGMAIAIHTAKLISELLFRYFNDASFTRHRLEFDYARAWRHHFATRLWIGRKTQHLFGKPFASGLGVGLLKHAPVFGKWLIRHTHGDVF